MKSKTVVGTLVASIVVAMAGQGILGSRDPWIADGSAALASDPPKTCVTIRRDSKYGEDDESHNGLDIQKTVLEESANHKERQWKILKDYAVGRQTGTVVAERKEIQDVKDMALTGRLGYVLVSVVDRLARNFREGLELAWFLRDHDVLVATPKKVYDIRLYDDLFWFVIELLFAQREIAKLTERVFPSLRRRLAEGNFVGAVPAFGTQKVGEKGNRKLAWVTHGKDVVSETFEYAVRLPASRDFYGRVRNEMWAQHGEWIKGWFDLVRKPTKKRPHKRSVEEKFDDGFVEKVLRDRTYEGKHVSWLDDGPAPHLEVGGDALRLALRDRLDEVEVLLQRKQRVARGAFDTHAALAANSPSRIWEMLAPCMRLRCPYCGDLDPHGVEGHTASGVRIKVLRCTAEECGLQYALPWGPVSAAAFEPLRSELRLYGISLHPVRLAVGRREIRTRTTMVVVCDACGATDIVANGPVDRDGFLAQEYLCNECANRFPVPARAGTALALQTKPTRWCPYCGCTESLDFEALPGSLGHQYARCRECGRTFIDQPLLNAEFTPADIPTAPAATIPGAGYAVREDPLTPVWHTWMDGG